MTALGGLEQLVQLEELVLCGWGQLQLLSLFITWISGELTAPGDLVQLQQLQLGVA